MSVSSVTPIISTNSGPLILRHACEMGLEGIVSKRRDAPYRSGRSDNFVKTKCHGRQEFVVAGYTPSAASPLGDRRAHRGRPPGWRAALRRACRHRLHAKNGARFVQTSRGATGRSAPGRNCRRTSAARTSSGSGRKLVVEAEFAGVTHGGVLRQASFKGIREDKTASEVVREVPAAMAGDSKNRTGCVRHGHKGRLRRLATAFVQRQICGWGGEQQATHASRSPLLAGCRRHQEESSQILRFGLGLDQTAYCRPRAVAGGGRGGDNWRDLLSEAHRRQRQIVAAAPDRSGQGSRRDCGAGRFDDLIAFGTIRRVGDSRPRIAARKPGEMRPHRVRPRSGGGSGLAANRRSQRARRASGSRRKTSKASSSSRAAKAFMSWCRSPTLSWGRGEAVYASDRLSDGRGQSEALSRQNDEVACARAAFSSTISVIRAKRRRLRPIRRARGPARRYPRRSPGSGFRAPPPAAISPCSI